MSYALVENGSVVSTNLPEIGKLPDGRQVSNFHKLDDETLKEVGWLPISELPVPDYDSETQRVDHIFEIKDDEVLLKYIVVDLPPVPEPEPGPPSVQEQLDSLIDVLTTKGTLNQSDISKVKEPK